MTLGTVVFMSGVPWDRVNGTDHHLARAIAETVDVLWVDPPASPINHWRSIRAGEDIPRGISPLDGRIRRLHVVALPGITKPVFRSVAGWLLRRRIRQYATRESILGVVLTDPEAQFPRVSATKVLYVTDDWPAGAQLLGLSRKRVESLLARNMTAADIVAAVSPELVEQLERGRTYAELKIRWLPNGCSTFEQPSLPSMTDAPNPPYAVLVGQLNDRIDGDLLWAVADAGVRIVVIGPRIKRRDSASESLDRALAHPNIRWLGYRPHEEIQAYLGQASVGLTPYVLNDFNRASFPLKSLEYLAAGLPVVSTNLPSVRHLQTPLITIGLDVQNFVAATKYFLARPKNPIESERRRDFVRAHSWTARATQLLSWISPNQPMRLDSLRPVPNGPSVANMSR
jgi:teichuronic acid biosynthesis glycosyltransferase TuaH